MGGHNFILLCFIDIIYTYNPSPNRRGIFLFTLRCLLGFGRLSTGPKVPYLGLQDKATRLLTTEDKVLAYINEDPPYDGSLFPGNDSLKTYNLYVNGTTGDDSNSGISEDKAFKTIQAAIDSCSIEKCIYNIRVAAGTYNEDLYIQSMYQIKLYGAISGDPNGTEWESLVTINSIYVEYNTSGTIYGFNIIGEYPTQAQNEHYAVIANNNCYMHLDHIKCTTQSSNVGETSHGSVCACHNSFISIWNSEISNKNFALIATGSVICTSNDVRGTGNRHCALIGSGFGTLAGRIYLAPNSTIDGDYVYGPAGGVIIKGNITDTFAAKDHTHTADNVTAGTLGGSVIANAAGVAALETKQLRNIYAGTSDIGVGASLPAGDIYLVYE